MIMDNNDNTKYKLEEFSQLYDCGKRIIIELKSDYDKLSATNDSNLAKFKTLHNALASLLEENER